MVSERYFKGGFALDLLIFLPIGYFMSLIDSKLKFFWVLKAIRIAKMNQYVSNRKIIPLIVKYIDKKQKRAVENEKMRSDINSDHIHNKEKQFYITTFKIVRLIF